MDSPPLAKRPSTFAVVAGFAAVYVLWGSTYLGIKYAIETLPMFTMAGTRFLLAGLALYAYARWKGAGRPTPRQWRDAIIVGGLLLFVSNGGVVWAQNRVTSGIAALLVATVPMWMVLLDWLRPGGVRPRGMVFVGLLLGLAGIALLKLPRSGAGAFQLDTVAAIVLVTVSLTWSIGSLYSRRAAKPDSALLGAGMQMIGGGMLHLLTGSLVVREWASFHPSQVSLTSLFAVAYLMVFGSIIGFTCYMWLLRVSTPAKVATYAYVNPMVALLLGWYIAHEPLDGLALAGAAVIVVGVGVVITTSRPAPTPVRTSDGAFPVVAAEDSCENTSELEEHKSNGRGTQVAAPDEVFSRT